MALTEPQEWELHISISGIKSVTGTTGEQMDTDGTKRT